MQSSVSAKLVAVAIIAAGASFGSTPAHAQQTLTTRCASEPLNTAQARLRLEWARACGARVNVVSTVSPIPPAAMYDTGVTATDGTPLIEYLETNDFWGKNSYSGDTADINGTYTRLQWRVGPIIATRDASSFQRWSRAASLALARPSYPIFGNSPDIGAATPLYPNPNYFLRDCNLYLDPAATLRADTSVTGFYVNAYCTANEVQARCADGTKEQVFSGGMVGCAGATTFANRNALCAPGSRVASAAEWTARRAGITPIHNYWTSNDLKVNGTGTGACFVSTTLGSSCGTTPMRVCTAAGTDAEGNVCNWQHCGLDANAPDQFFGGCSGNTTAGALCIVGGCADGTIEQTFAGGMVGCGSSVGFESAALLCGPGFRLATAAEWVALRAGIVPTHNYWTKDALKWNGTGPSACFVSTTVGNTTCGASPMRVCSQAGTDAEGNWCNWTHCGLDANSPDQFFGGCASDAGALCIPMP